MFSTTLTRRPNLRPRTAHRDPLFTLVDRFLGDSAVGDLSVSADSTAERTWLPPVDIMETDAAFVATVDLPGLTKDDIDLSLEDNVLTLSGQRSQAADLEDVKLRRSERVFGKFNRTFTLPRGVEGSKVSATFENGVLALSLPKSEVSQLRKIEIS